MAREKTLDVLTHILAILTWIIGPLIVLLVTKDAITKRHAKQALNWQISYTIYMVIALFLLLLLIGFVLAPILMVLDVVFCIIAAVKASQGRVWNYPLAIPFLK